VHRFHGEPPAHGGFDAVANWVDEQQRYFADRARLEGRRRDVLGGVSGALGVVSVIASLALLAILLGHVRGPTRLLPDIGIVAGASALCVAVMRSYARTRGHSENANRYQRMSFVLDRAAEALAAAPGDEAAARAVAAELGRLALAEHAEWLLLQRERPIAMVATSAA
jgi:hypothetical protein